MGLDMYAYRAKEVGQREAYWDGAEYNTVTSEYENRNVTKPPEIAYWRKHSSLHGWFKRLWESQGNSGDFNGDELELTLDDLLDLEIDIQASQLPATQGFFFGDGSNTGYYREEDLEFIKAARKAIAEGDRVFYNSSW